MITETAFYTKLADSQFQSGVEITPNKGAGGSTYTGTVVFYAPAYGLNISAVYPIINTIKVGGGNLFTEEAKFEFEFGTYDSSGFHPFSGWKGSFTVSEGTVRDKQCTIDGGTVHIKPNEVMAYRLKVSSNKSSRVANTTMTDFRLKFDYELFECTITLNANGGTCPVSSITRVEGNYYNTVTSAENNPTKAGYTFSYWATNADGTGRIYSSTVVTGNTTLYAIYVLDKIEKTLIDSLKPKKILIDNQEVKAIYVDTTKVYG